MRAASEHPRIVTTIAAALIVLALAGVGAGWALGGANPIRTNDAAHRLVESEAMGPRQQLRAARAQSAALREEPGRLTDPARSYAAIAAACAGQVALQARVANALISTVHHRRRYSCSPT